MLSPIRVGKSYLFEGYMVRVVKVTKVAFGHDRVVKYVGAEKGAPDGSAFFKTFQTYAFG